MENCHEQTNLVKKEIPSAEMFDISNAERISWEFPDCKWTYKKPLSGYVIIVPNRED